MFTDTTVSAPTTRGAPRVLQSAVADLLALALVAKHVHWNVVGPRFTPLHALFDEMASSHLEAADRAAERLRAMELPVDGRPATVSAATVVPEPPEGFLRHGDAIARVIAAVEWVAARIRERIEEIGPDDPASRDLVVGILASLDHFAWMLRGQW